MMKLKKDEFRKLRQGAMSVLENIHKFTELSRYAPEDINDDEKKQEAFLSGLNSEIRTIVEVTVHNDFNAMVNRAITTERNKKAEFNERKRRFESKKPQQPEKFQRTQFPAHSSHRSQGAMPPKAHPSSFQKLAQSAPLQKTQGTFHTQQMGGGSQVTNMRACFHIRERGHLIANCPYKNQPAPSVFSNSVNGPRQPTGANRTTPAKIQQSFGKAKVNHVYSEEAEEAPGVIFGEFLVNSVLASVLFDSGPCHSFISSHFVKKNDIPTIALKRPLMTRSPGGHIPCHLGVIDLPINLSGVAFLANLVDWLTKHRGNKACAERAVTITNHQGVAVTSLIHPSLLEAMVNHIQAESPEDVPIVQEFAEVFPDELPGMPP
jgi:hypothetical protein